MGFTCEMPLIILLKCTRSCSEIIRNLILVPHGDCISANKRHLFVKISLYRVIDHSMKKSNLALWIFIDVAKWYYRYFNYNTSFKNDAEIRRIFNFFNVVHQFIFYPALKGESWLLHNKIILKIIYSCCLEYFFISSYACTFNELHIYLIQWFL